MARGQRARDRARPASTADCLRFDPFPAIRRRRAGRVPNAQPPRRLPPLGLCWPPGHASRGTRPHQRPVARDRGRPAIVIQPHSRAELPPRSPELPASDSRLHARRVTQRGGHPPTGWVHCATPSGPVRLLSFPSSGLGTDSSADAQDLVPKPQLGNGRLGGVFSPPTLVHSFAFGYHSTGKVAGRRSAHSHLMAGWPFISRFGRNPKRNRSRIATSQHLGLFRQKAL